MGRIKCGGGDGGEPARSPSGRDYPLGNHDILFKQTRSLVKTQRMKCLGFGGIISAFTMIPIVNFFVMPVAVAGATAFYVDTFKGTNTK